MITDTETAHHDKGVRKWLQDLTFWGIVLVNLFVVYLMYLLFAPVNVLYVKQPYKVLTHQIKAGDYLKYEVDYCKYLSAPGKVNMSFVDGIVVTLPETTSNSQPKCDKGVESIYVPLSLVPGKYKLNVDLSYQVNPIRNVYYHFQTEEFEIIAANSTTTTTSNTTTTTSSSTTNNGSPAPASNPSFERGFTSNTPATPAPTPAPSPSAQPAPQATPQPGVTNDTHIRFPINIPSVGEILNQAKKIL